MHEAAETAAYGLRTGSESLIERTKNTEAVVEEVSEFVVIAPAGQGKAMQFAQERVLAHLARRFPHYSFMLEAFGPYVEEDEFSVIPIMNRRERPGDELGVMYMCRPLDPRVIPEIKAALREFELVPELVH